LQEVPDGSNQKIGAAGVKALLDQKIDLPRSTTLMLKETFSVSGISSTSPNNPIGIQAEDGREMS
jgi:hypothetical protein